VQRCQLQYARVRHHNNIILHTKRIFFYNWSTAVKPLSIFEVFNIILYYIFYMCVPTCGNDIKRDAILQTMIYRKRRFDGNRGVVERPYIHAV